MRETLLRTAMAYLLVWAGLLSLYLLLPGIAGIIAGIVFGFLTVNMVHEWGHLCGALMVDASFTLRERPGFFIFDWDFDGNRLPQFLTMSIAGNLAGVFALLGLALAGFNPATPVIAGAAASIAFAAAVEMPVLYRVRHSGNPLQELQKITPMVLLVSALLSVATGVVSWHLF